MTNRELKIWAWSCLAFGWAVELVGTYLKAPNVYLLATSLFGLSLWLFLNTHGGGGPLKPA
jgi:hypothetical protein